MEFKTKVDRTVIAQLSPEGMQKLNHMIYGEVNATHYEKRDMVSFMNSHARLMLKCLRKARLEEMPYHTAMICSWGLALANKLDVNVGDELWRWFPGICPYCSSVPCKGDPCKQGKARARTVAPHHGVRPHCFQGFQDMFGRIYPYSRKTLWIAVSHVNEEIGEMDEALRLFMGMREQKHLDQTTVELTDVFTTLFAVANALRFDLAAEMGHWFGRGCPICNGTPCTCGFVILNNGVPIGRILDPANHCFKKK